METYADRLRTLADMLDADFKRNANTVSKELCELGRAIAIEHGEQRERYGWKALEQEPDDE